MLSPENLFFGQCNLALQRCDWTSRNALVFEMKRLSETPDAVVEPAVAFMALHLPLTASERHEVARRAAAIAQANAAALPAPSARSHSRIRIGVLSPDLREHIVAHLLLPLFELLDRKKFELYAYSLVADGMSEIRNKLCAAADRFRDLHGVSDKEAADQIRRDGIDILIDVSGHTTGTRFGIAARRPAHVQAQYLGFAGSLGSTRLDYVIVDPIVDTSPAEWSEIPIRLPHTYYLYDFRTTPSDINLSRRDYGLPEGAFVYCAFHKPEKISPDVFLLWMRILQQVDSSVLWLMTLPATAQQNLRREASARGVDPARLLFAPFEPRHDPRYLARHRLGDLMLDALHYNAIATACDALAVGLPVLTLCGTSMASRSGESLLRAAGVPELVAPDQEAYVEQAVQLASGPEPLAGYRRTLATRSGPLFDTAGRVRELENAFLQMWRQHEQRH